MNGTTLLEINAGTRNTPFNRPSPLKIPGPTTSDFGKHAWNSHRTLWADSGAVNNRSSDDMASRPDTLRQESSSFAKFGRPTTSSALSPLENPRGSARTNDNPWASAVSPSNTRHSGPVASPAKQKQGSWPYSDDLDFDNENSGLLQGSAPDIDPLDDLMPVAASSNDQRTFLPSREERTLPFFTTRGSAHYMPNGSNLSNSAIPSRQQYNRAGAESVQNISPGPRRFGTTSTYETKVNLHSPASARFLTSWHRDNYNPSEQQMLSKTIDSMSAMTLTTPSPQVQNSITGSDPFRDSGQGVSRSNQIMPHDQPLQWQLNVANADFQPSRHSNKYNAVDDAAAPVDSTTMWTYEGRGTPYNGDFRQNLQGSYYSVGATPPTGPDSGRSAAGSGISSRTSHHDFSQVNRKLGEVDVYQQHPLYQANGVFQNTNSAYDFSTSSSARMNPLAGNYTPYSMSAFSMSNLGGYSPTPRFPPREPEPLINRSPLLEDFRVNQKTHKRYELRDIFEHIVEFSGDQHSSRFIQQKLETANSDEKDQVFKEIEPNCLQLMTDVFGNYVIQKLFEHGDQSQKKVLAHHMKGHVLSLSTQMYGCRVVQKALEHVLVDQQASMVKELDGPNKQILKVIRDQNGNHVVQKAIERGRPEHIQFIVEAHKGEVVKLATHTYGCRVIQRILEHCTTPAKRIILDELHGCVGPLITDSFGNYVVQHVIQKGELDDRRRVVAIVQAQLLNFSKHKFASNVVEKCIEHADMDQRAEIVRRLIGANEQGQSPVLGLLRDQYGNYVIQKVHALLEERGPQPELEALSNEMKLCFPQLKRTSYGKQVMAIEKLLYGGSTPPSATVSNRSSTGPPPNINGQNNAGGLHRLVASNHTFSQAQIGMPNFSHFGHQ